MGLLFSKAEVLGDILHNTNLIIGCIFCRTCDKGLSAQAETGGATCVASFMAPSGGHKQ